jgi:hypothetical protein
LNGAQLSLTLGYLSLNLSRQSAHDSSLTINGLSQATKLFGVRVTASTTSQLLGFFYKGLL